MNPAGSGIIYDEKNLRIYWNSRTKKNSHDKLQLFLDLEWNLKRGEKRYGENKFQSANATCIFCTISYVKTNYSNNK